MKTKFSIFFVIILSVIGIIALDSCVDPIIGNFDPPQKIAGWPKSVSLEDYGIGDWSVPPVDATDIWHWFEKDENGEDQLIITFKGTAGSEYEILDEKGGYFKSWDLYNTEQPVNSYEYGRGISYAVFDRKASSRYQISIEKTLGVAGIPNQARLEEFQIEGIQIPANDDTKISYLFSFIPYDPDNDFNHTYHLTIMIYGKPVSGFEEATINYLENLGFLTEVSDQPGIDPAYHVFVGESFISAHFDTRSSPYYNEIDILKEYDGQLGWPDMSLMGEFGAFRLREPAGAKDSTYIKRLFGETEDETDGDTLYVRFYGAKDGSTENVVKDYFNNNTWKEETSLSPDILSYSRGISMVEFDTSFRNFYEIGITKRLGGRNEWPDKATRTLFNILGDNWNEPAWAVDSAHVIAQDDWYETSNLTIWFNSGNTPLEDIENRFFTDWCPEESDFPGIVYDYSRGTFNASFNIESAPYYEITIEENDSTPGWPNATLRTQYGNGTGKADWDEPIGMPGYVHENTTYTRDPLEGILSFQFYWPGVTEEFVKDRYFGETWVVEPKVLDDPTTIVYRRGTSLGCFIARGHNYYEIDLFMDICEAGWPASLIKGGKYGSGTDNWDQPSGPKADKYIPDYTTYVVDDTDGSITVRFYWNDTPEKVKEYFFGTAEKPLWHNETTELSGENIEEFSRGTTFVAFDTTDAEYHYYGLAISKIADCEAGWPGSALRTKYKLTASEWNPLPAGNYPVFMEDTVTDPLNHVLTIRFYWDSAETVRTHYFNNWFVEPVSDTSEEGVIEFSRSIINATLDIREAPFYEMTLSRNPEIKEGWPSILFKSGKYGSGTDDWDEPTNPLYVSDYTTYLEDTITDPLNPSITVRFYWNADRATVEDYFFRTWCQEQAIDTNGDGILEIEYSRGSTYAAFNIADAAQHYYEITLTRNTECTPGWPGSTIRSAYGGNGTSDSTWNGPVNNGPTAVQYPVYSIDNTDPVNPSLIIRFYWANATADPIKNVRDYFFNSTWGTEVTEDPVTLLPVIDYFRGTTSAAFSSDDSPYYEITLTRNNDCIAGWPGQSIRALYGNGTMPEPSGTGTGNYNSAFTTYSVDSTDPANPSLVIRFYWEDTTSNPEQYVNDYFFDSTWCMEVTEDPVTLLPVIDYVRGTTTAAFSSDYRPYYEITLTRISDCIAGWPGQSLRAQYGNGTMPEPSGASAANYNSAYTTYIVDTTDPANPTLTVRFYWTDLTTPTASIAAVQSYFFTDSWVEEPETTPGILEFARGSTFASFDPTGHPYYEITFTKDAECMDGWPNSSLRAEYGIADWNSPPLGADFITHLIDTSPDPLDPLLTVDSLVVRFYGAAGIVSTVNNTFNSSSWIEEDMAIEGIYEYSRGTALAAFDTISAPPYYEIDFSKNTDCTAGWPTQTIRDEYGISGWSSAPTGTIAGTIAYQVDTATACLSIWFNNPSAPSELSYFASGNGWTLVPDPSPGYAYEYYSSFHSAGVIISGQQYVIEISKDTETTSQWPTLAIWQKYGLTNLAQPSNVTGILCGEIGNELTLTFTGPSSVLSTISSHFTGTANNWFADNTTMATNPTRTIYEFRKGKFEAALTVSGSGSNTSYELVIGIDTTVMTGWPVAGVWTSLGLSSMNQPSSATAGTTGIGYSTANNGLLIWYNGTTGNGSGTTQSQSIALFTSNAWVTTSTGNTNGTAYEYSKGKWDASLRIKGGYFEIEFSQKANAMDGWPSAGTLTSYRLNSSPLPTNGISSVGYILDTSSGGSLTIWFNASNASQAKSAIQSWINNSGWSTSNANAASPVGYWHDTITPERSAELFFNGTYLQLVVDN